MSEAEVTPRRLPSTETESPQLYVAVAGGVMVGCLVASYVNVQVAPGAHELYSISLPTTKTGCSLFQLSILASIEQVMTLAVGFEVSTEMTLHIVLTPSSA